MILVTGAAGFIGFHLTVALLSRGETVVGVDNLNSYYDPALKSVRLLEISKHPNACNFQFERLDISDRDGMEGLFERYKFKVVVNLAAQAGVRYSLQDPHAYTDSNITGFLNILEGCRSSEVKHLVYASSSSVYGMNIKQPFSSEDRADHPISLYAATKRSNELMAYTYSHLFNIPMTGLRFFTVYGPFGRPDMAYYKFTEAILSGLPIQVYNMGNQERDFTYIDDIVEGLVLTLHAIPSREPSQYSNAPAAHRILNIGNNSPVSLSRFISAIESSTGCTAVKNYLPMQDGDVPSTFADIQDLTRLTGFSPSTSIEAGIEKFVRWYVNSR